MSSFVRSAGSVAGEGQVLLAAMQSEWRETQSVVIFYPASESLVGYYSRQGAVIDDGARRRMKFDFRHHQPSPQTARDPWAWTQPRTPFAVRRLQRDLRNPDRLIPRREPTGDSAPALAARCCTSVLSCGSSMADPHRLQRQ